MSAEREYDEIIAPALAEISQKCTDLGMSIVARVEWATGEAGITYQGVSDDSGIAQRLALYAALCRGNLDDMIIGMRRDGIDMSQTIYGSRFDS